MMIVIMTMAMVRAMIIMTMMTRIRIILVLLAVMIIIMLLVMAMAMTNERMSYNKEELEDIVVLDGGIKVLNGDDDTNDYYTCNHVGAALLRFRGGDRPQ